MEAMLTVHSDLRRAIRKRVLMTATVVGADSAQRALIKDLTTTGAGIRCDTPLKRGSDVVLKRGELFVAARVAWVDGPSAGLEFYRSLPPTELVLKPLEQPQNEESDSGFAG